MENKQQKKFYHGTSTIYNLTDYISPIIKALNINANVKITKKHPPKFRITSDLNRAVFYANTCAQKKGGKPIVYEVEPDRYSLVKVGKDEYCTVNAKILGTVDLEQN